jgi:hypothetical protein
MISEASPGSLPSLATIKAARDTSLESAPEFAAGAWWEADPAGAVGCGADVAANTATAAAAAPIPAPRPTLPRAREDPLPRTGATAGTGAARCRGPDSAMAPRSRARARSYSSGRQGATSST